MPFLTTTPGEESLKLSQFSRLLSNFIIIQFLVFTRIAPRRRRCRFFSLVVFLSKHNFMVWCAVVGENSFIFIHTFPVRTAPKSMRKKPNKTLFTALQSGSELLKTSKCFEREILFIWITHHEQLFLPVNQNGTTWSISRGFFVCFNLIFLVDHRQFVRCFVNKKKKSANRKKEEGLVIIWQNYDANGFLHGCNGPIVS